MVLCAPARHLAFRGCYLRPGLWGPSGRCSLVRRGCVAGLPTTMLRLLICAVLEVGLYPRAVAADEVPGALADKLRSLVDPTG